MPNPVEFFLNLVPRKIAPGAREAKRIIEALRREHRVCFAFGSKETSDLLTANTNNHADERLVWRHDKAV
jgi:hypothetical protein